MSMCDYCMHHDCKQPQWAITATLKGDMYCQAFKSFLKRNISMAYVTPSFVTGNKNVTRRDWANVTVEHHHKDTKVLVWNKQSRFGGEPMGVLQLTENPYKQVTNLMTMDDYANEGFEYMDTEYYQRTQQGKPLVDAFASWKRRGEWMTVVPFKILEVFPTCEERYTTDDEIKRCVKALVKAIG